MNLRLLESQIRLFQTPPPESNNIETTFAGASQFSTANPMFRSVGTKSFLE